MSQLNYFRYPGWGLFAHSILGYSQAVRIGDQIQISGQGGWPTSTSKPEDMANAFPSDLKEEIAQAFVNVDAALRDAGGQGWSQVYRVNSYHTTELDMDLGAIMKEQFEKWMPNHSPIWTEVGVRQLGAPGMRVEIEVSAYDPSK